MSEITKLLDGNKIFRKQYFGKESSLFDSLVEHGQRPKVMMIACSDSRVDPSIILNCKPGDLFVIRSMANLIPPCEDTKSYHGTSATVEFGTCFLEVEHIIIFGHTRCGGIQALFNNPVRNPDASFIAKWMDIAQPAYDMVMEKYSNASLEEKVILCEQYALINSLRNLRTFPWIEERVARGSLALHAWYFDLATGKINRYDQETHRWICDE